MAGGAEAQEMDEIEGPLANGRGVKKGRITIL
jgi:hypothetical protein